MKTTTHLFSSIRTCLLAICLSWCTNLKADLLLHFPFNEGSGTVTTDIASGATGVFGIAQDPEVDYVQIIDASPSGLANDRSITNSGSGFLLADDSATQVLNITNGPITMETWIYIDPFTPAKTAEGILAYGGSYKMGMRSGKQVFTLYGIVDIVNESVPFLPSGQWVHLAAAWEPGVGVHFYVDGVQSFQANTNTAARPVRHNYLSLASEGLGNNSVAAFDRMRIHNALLSADQIDSDAANPKPPLASTIVSYNFNEESLPATNEVEPAIPTVLSSDLLPPLTGPEWTNDTPSGLEGDFALAFLSENPPVKEVVTVDLSSMPLNLGANNTNYTLQAWVKLPTGPLEERRVIYRTDGPGPRISLSINANRTLHTTVLGTADFTTGVRVPNDERWHHIAVVMENFERLHFYLDGALRQTVNRTQERAATGSNTARLLIGKESETRYFRGLLDRVIIHNHALTQAELDYPAAPGLATFEAQPADVVVDAGSTATFTATPTSATAATYQWHFRENLADQESVPVAGATSTTLTLNNVDAGDEGYYFLVVTNEAGVSESHAARLILQSSLALGQVGFEPPKYVSGPIDGQHHWTTDRNANTARVLTSEEITEFLEATGRTAGQPVHSGNQALVVSGSGLSSATIRTVPGFEAENKVTVDVWIRPIGAGSISAPIGNAFFTVENEAGVRAAAFRLGAGNSLDYGTAASGVWRQTGVLWDENTWHHITLIIDYAAKTYEMIIDGTPVDANPIAFYNSGSDRFNQLRIFRGTNQAGLIVDDLSVTSPNVAPTLDVRLQDGDVVVSWPATASDYQLQATDSLETPSWTPVAHNVVGAENQAVIEPAGESRFFRLIKQ